MPRTSWLCYAGDKLAWKAETPMTFVPSVGDVITIPQRGAGRVTHVSLVVAGLTGERVSALVELTATLYP